MNNLTITRSSARYMGKCKQNTDSPIKLFKSSGKINRHLLIDINFVIMILNIYVLTVNVYILSTVWGYSSAAIVTISLLGLLSVSLIPCLQKVFLNTVLQFLVALAVGALSGDAMLHLIPHVSFY